MIQSQPGHQLPDLELRHRAKPAPKDRIWPAVVALAGDLLAWMQTLALHDHPARC